MTEAKGLNIVMTTNAVDNFIKPDMVVMYRFELDERNTFSAVPCTTAVEIKNGAFELTDFVAIAENRWYVVESESDSGELKQ